jgi:protein-disulfide isomerase
MNSSTKLGLILTGALLAIVALVVGVLFLVQPPKPEVATNPETQLPSTFAADTHVLSEAETGQIVLVEFLDFECEACGAFHPYVEELRAEYGDQVTFAFRYFPLPSHGNSVNAALAVEAAARQDRLEDMYNKLFTTQAIWGEKGQESQAPLFREFAEELGLDLAQYDQDVADPDVLARVLSDFDAGVSLGVQSTPSFFLNDERLTLQSFEDLRAAIEAAIAEAEE